MLANEIRRVALATTRLYPRFETTIKYQKRSFFFFFTRHVPEPRMVIHQPIPQSADESKSIVLPDATVDELKPVVLVLGWAGARQNHLDKYVDIYLSEGYRVVSLAPPCYHYSIPNSRVGFYMSPLFRAIDAKPGDFRSFAKCPIIIHSFSMNGVRALISFWKWTEAEERTELRERIKGIIFDSAPARPGAKQDATAMVISTPPIEPLYGVVSRDTRISLLTFMLNVRNAIAIPLSATMPFLRSFLSLYYYLQDRMQLPKNQLFLFSQADEMIKAKHVEKFIAKQNDKGAQTSSIDFETSPHVRHMPENEDQYRQACLSFVQHVQTIYQNDNKQQQ